MESIVGKPAVFDLLPKGNHYAIRCPELDALSAELALEKDEGYGARVLLRTPGRDVEVGRHLDAEARVEFAAELSKRLRI